MYILLSLCTMLLNTYSVVNLQSSSPNCCFDSWEAGSTGLPLPGGPLAECLALEVVPNYIYIYIYMYAQQKLKLLSFTELKINNNLPTYIMYLFFFLFCCIQSANFHWRIEGEREFACVTSQNELMINSPPSGRGVFFFFFFKKRGSMYVIMYIHYVNCGL